MAAFHCKMAVPDNCVLAVYGDVDPERVRAEVTRAFAAWKRPQQFVFNPPAPAERLAQIRRAVETRDKKQAVLILGYPGTTIQDPDRYALELLQESCSDLGSRLFLRIRESLGLAYYVGAQNFIGVAPGYFALYAGTAPEKAAQVEQELLKETELLRAEGLTEEELKRAKAKIVGQRKIARQDLGGLAMSHALDELFGLGYQHSDFEDAEYEAVTLDQVKAVAQKYLSPSAFVMATIAPAVQDAS
jgi:zinc protease